MSSAAKSWRDKWWERELKKHQERRDMAIVKMRRDDGDAVKFKFLLAKRLKVQILKARRIKKIKRIMNLKDIWKFQTEIQTRKWICSISLLWQQWKKLKNILTPKIESSASAWFQGKLFRFLLFRLI